MDQLNEIFKNISIDKDKEKTQTLVTYKNDRPTFYFENNLRNPLRAGGVLFYKRFEGNLKFLIIKKLNRFSLHEDIGGKTDINDTDISDTISREVWEETNNVIDREIIKEQLKTGVPVYYYFSKYLLYLIEANSDQEKLDSESFGDSEIHDSIRRQIYWINAEDYINNKFNFNPRLDNSVIREFIKEFMLSLHT